MPQANLNENLRADELHKLRLFHTHFKEFWDNFDELRKLGLNLSASFSLESNGKVHGGELGISRHRLKGVFLDYRLFHQQNEPVHFLKICKILERRCRDERFLRKLEIQRKAWKQPEAPVVGWHNSFSAIDVVDAYFNEELFHLGVGNTSNFQLSEIREKLTEEALMYSMVHIVYSRLLVLRNVNFLIAPVLDGHPYFRLPD